ncbi:MAG: hypothetical protein PHW82_06210 [Bacteroidales bacterium]|nr:hypothetical protein [Bacteroidales bacterium]
MKNKLFYFVAVLSIVFNSCAVGHKLDNKVSLVVDVSHYADSYQTTSNKYVDKSLGGEYLNAFLTELKSSLRAYNIETVTKNIKNSLTTAIYLLQVNSITFSEKFETESVYTDGETAIPERFDVVSCNFNANLRLYKADKTGREKLLKFYSSSFSKSEELSNNRTLLQMIFGENKDGSKYTYKELDDDVMFDLSRKSARRIAAKTSKIISKNL